MGYNALNHQLEEIFKLMQKEYIIYAPKCFKNGGRFSDTDCIRYSQVKSILEISFDRKSLHSFKEAVLPISQLLYYFSEKEIKDSKIPEKKILIFLRSCDLHAVKRLDQIFLENGQEDYNYKRTREKLRFALIGCKESFENCFCVSMGTNISKNYDFSIDLLEDKTYDIDSKNEEFDAMFKKVGLKEKQVTPSYVTENKIKVKIPENLSVKASKSKIWDQYDTRCISCGRCNYVCPTCTCFNIQDMYYDYEGKIGERRRVWASCMLNGFLDTDKDEKKLEKNGEKMRYKTMHKVLDFRERFGYNMCVGCGRCDDVCPKYISFSKCINDLQKAMEVNENE